MFGERFGKRANNKREKMKRIIISSIVLLAVALGTGAQAQSFTSGNLVIYRLGGKDSGATDGKF